jgi:hypothetical protein
MISNQDFLLHPLATADLPVCPGCGRPLAIAVHEVRENSLIVQLTSAMRVIVRSDLFASNRKGACRLRPRA